MRIAVGLGAALLVGVAALPLSGCVREAKVVATGPNVLLVVVDTLRADHLGAYGYPFETTPHLDALARDATRYNNAIAVAPWTTPSVTGILSSRFPREFDFDETLPDETVLLPELFEQAGYRTSAVVSHLFVSGRLGFDQGFESYDESEARGAQHISSAEVTRKAIELIDRHGDEPWFLFVHYFDPHNDYFLHPGFEFFPEYDGDLRGGEPLLALRERAPGFTPADLRYLLSLYDSEIRYTDEQIGRLLAALRERGLWDDTLIVVTADHGEEFADRGDHYIGHSTTLHQEQVHVPLILKLPQQTRGEIVDAFVSQVDLAPTLAAVAGVPVPEPDPFQGRNLASTPEDGYVFSEQPTLSAVIHQGWKLIHRAPGNRIQLFDLDSDPGERRNVARSHPERVRSLQRALVLHHADSAKRRRRGGHSVEFDPAERDLLRELGYVE
jgi:arylsulfatase A-like enzyme